MFTSKLARQSSLLVRSYATAAGKQQFKLSTESIADRLKNVSEKYPYYDALLFPNESNSLKFNFQEMWGSVSGLASGFVESNLKSQEAVLTNAPQSSEHIITQMAASTAGLTFVPVAPSSTLPQIGEVLATSSTKAFVLANQKSREIVDEAIEYFPTLDSMGHDEYFKDNRYPSLRYIISTGNAQEPGIDLYKEFVLQVNLLNKTKTSANQISTLLPSTDGKLIGYTHGSLLNTGDSLVQLLGLKRHERVSFAVPFHSGSSYAFYLGCLSNASTVIVPAHIFSVETTLNTITQNKSTVLFVTGEQLDAILNFDKLSKFNTTTLKTVVVAGSNVSAATLKSVQDKLKVNNVFGVELVENTPGQLAGVVFNQSGAGQLLPGVESKVDNGVLFTKGYHVNSNTKEWLNTGIKAKINQDGTVSRN
ncbi:putative acyl-CoA synthetase [Heterostelium album PN500]|uniref:Putative acyl-CoA synthetase n=1 Tax=Heterostelium pallidum (strain ATCC 26659 / Pp 5 / PN500) TaxID=670386 RepID=D3BHG5_HETP5|nr:putative acyl-CoA synthetase [Heterostelium album PN500]EFA79142.1 putative acyl-CoA synthetase [Heterostelium album PN500]|eukprot:XP_020431264.1 putative acyl-CoA synthetase [Heterostelium album PN500]